MRLTKFNQRKWSSRACWTVICRDTGRNLALFCIRKSRIVKKHRKLKTNYIDYADYAGHANSVDITRENEVIDIQRDTTWNGCATFQRRLSQYLCGDHVACLCGHLSEMYVRRLFCNTVTDFYFAIFSRNLLFVMALRISPFMKDSPSESIRRSYRKNNSVIQSCSWVANVKVSNRKYHVYV